VHSVTSEILLLRQQLADSLKKISELDSSTKKMEEQLQESKDSTQRAQNEAAAANKYVFI